MAQVDIEFQDGDGVDFEVDVLPDTFVDTNLDERVVFLVPTGGSSGSSAPRSYARVTDACTAS